MAQQNTICGIELTLSVILTYLAKICIAGLLCYHFAAAVCKSRKCVF